MAQAIDIHRPEVDLTRTGLELKKVAEVWRHKPNGQRYTDAMLTFLGSKDNVNTRRLYAFGLLEFFGWFHVHRKQIPLPNEVRRADAYLFVQYLQSRTLGLEEYRLEQDANRGMDLEIYRIVKRSTGCNITTIRQHLMGFSQFTTTVDFTASGRPQRLRVLDIEQNEPRGDALAAFVQETGRTPVNGLDLRLGCLCAHKLLRRTPTIAQIRKSKVDIGEKDQDQAQIQYRVAPETFRYYLDTHSDAAGVERSSTILARLSALSAFWTFLIQQSAENHPGAQEQLIQHNIWQEPREEIRKKSRSRTKASRELKTPSLDLFLRVLGTCYVASHGASTADATADAALYGADVSTSAIAHPSLYDLRDRAVLLFAFWTGVRADELSSIRRSQIDMQTGLITIVGKGDETRSFVVPEPALRAVSEFQDGLAKAAEPASDTALLRRLILPDAPLFPPLKLWGSSAKDEHTTVDGISAARFAMLLHDRAVTAGMEKGGPDWRKIHPHGLRHLAALEANRRGVDVATIQATLGHSSLSTTGLYLEVRDPLKRSLMPQTTQPAAARRTATPPTVIIDAQAVEKPSSEEPPAVPPKRVRSALVFTDQFKPSLAAQELAMESSAVATLLEIYKDNWGEKAKRTAILVGGKGALAHAYVGKQSGLPWWTGATGNMADESFSYTPNVAFPAMPIVSPGQFLGDEGSSVCSEPLCKALSQLYDAWFDDPELGPTAAAALSQWLVTSSAITVDVDDVLRQRHGGWVVFETELTSTTFEGRPTTLRQHLDDAIVTWFKHSGWQFRPTTETRIPQGGELEIPAWYGEADPLQSLPERERLELLDWLQVLVGLPPKDTTDRFNGVSRAALGKLLSDICSYETTAADIELGDTEKHEYLSAIDDQIQKRVGTLTQGRTTNFRYSESKSGRKTDKMRSELQKKIAKREEREDTTERAGRGLGPYMMATLGELFGESVETDQVLSLFAMCTSGAPLKDVADKYKNLFRVVAGSIYHTAEFKAAFAKETGQHSECVARRLARHIYEEGRLEQWYKRRNWPDTTIPYLEAMSAYRIPCPTSQEHELRGLIGGSAMPLYEVWRQAKGRLLGAMEPEDYLSDIDSVRVDETSRRVAHSTPKASDLTANPRSPLHKRTQNARRFLPNPMDILAIIFGIKRGRK